ncbi:MAG: HesA/MoeB/ThiF family protein [Gemmataceae bacterium]|nr:HesA/MoeB/ThiF family protein [Gemmataceae bacterium]
MMDLTPEERATYEWQMWVLGLGEEGQAMLKAATVLVTRVGGIGSLAAYELAAAGLGRLVLAHAGNIKPSDLNRQLLMTHEALGTSRVECASRRLRELNPRLDVITHAENVNASNVENLVLAADLVVCCVPLFEERLLLNAECLRQGKPMIDCAMYELSGQITTILPGQTACLACRVPVPPASWKREFPVLGAVAGTMGCLGALEAIKLITGVGEPLGNRLLTIDMRDMRLRTVQVTKRVDCEVCGAK